MLEINYETARLKMVDNQIRSWDVLDPSVCAVMQQLPRERFTPERYRNLAYADSEIPIGNGQVMLRPSVQARMLQAAQVHAGELALEIGTGTGYLAACLAALGARVRSVDIYDELVGAARTSLAAQGYDDVELAVEDAHTLAEDGPEYDVILVTGSLPLVDPAFGRRLAPGGRLVWIVGEAPAMRAELVTRVGADEWRTEGLFETAVAPLAGVERPRRFEF